jgi:hypothetical protein
MFRNRLLMVGVFSALIGIPMACKPRAYNQSRFKDLIMSQENLVTLCTMVAPRYDSSSGENKASVRVACSGQCNGVDYRTRRFYVLNEEKVAGIEFSATLSNGSELRDLYLFSPTNTLLASLKALNLENPDVQKSLQSYGLDPVQVTQLALPADGRVLLNPGTKASLSQAGLLAGGTLDCGGQPIEGSIELDGFKEQNMNDIKKTTAVK